MSRTGLESEQQKIWDVYGTPQHADDQPLLVVDVDGFEGPLDLLLSLTRDQKVDITRISILALAEQYLDFIEKIRGRRLEIAADYLVMAAWLAFLKSRLLLPDGDDGEEPSGEALAAELALRLRRLEAMREAAARLATRDRLGRDVFSRGRPDPIEVTQRNEYSATIYDLLSAYAAQRQRNAVSIVHLRRRQVWSLRDARETLVRLLPAFADWTSFDEILMPYFSSGPHRRSIAASALGASLELVREGRLELRQAAPYAPLYIRNATGSEQASQEPGYG